MDLSKQKQLWKDFLVHQGNLKPLCIFDAIKEIFLSFRSDDGIVIIFFKDFICYTYWVIYRWNNLLSGIYFNISQHGVKDTKRDGV